MRLKIQPFLFLFRPLYRFGVVILLTGWLVYIHLDALIPPYKAVLIVNSKSPINDILVHLDGREAAVGSREGEAGGHIFAWDFILENGPRPEFTVSWRDSDGQTQTFAETAYYQKNVRSCLYLLSIDAGAQATQATWTTICR